MSSDFAVSINVESRGTVVAISGELDVASGRTLERELEQLHETALVIVDLGAVTFVDSTGLGVLVRAHRLALEHGNRLALVGASGQVNRLLSLTGLDDQLLLGESAEQLLAGG